MVKPKNIEKQKPKQIQRKDFYIEIIAPMEVLIFECIILCAYEIFRHYQEFPDFAFKNAGLLVFCLVGYIGLRAFRKNTIFVKVENTNWSKILIWSIITWVLGMLIQFTIGQLEVLRKLAIANWEIYMFYVNASIAENTLFFGYLQISMVRLSQVFFSPSKAKLKLLGKKVYLGSSIFTSLVVSILFMSGHLVVYQTEIAGLIVVFLFGILWSNIVFYTRDLFVITVGHIINNVLTAGIIVRTSMINQITNDLVVTPLSEILLIILTVMTFLIFSYMIFKPKRVKGKKPLIKRKY